MIETWFYYHSRRAANLLLRASCSPVAVAVAATEEGSAVGTDASCKKYFFSFDVISLGIYKYGGMFIMRHYLCGDV